MKFKETETLELKKSTSELKEGVISVAAILNKHGRGKLYFGIRRIRLVFKELILFMFLFPFHPFWNYFL